MSQKENQNAAQPQSAAPQVLELDPKALLGMLAQMFQQQAEATRVNKQLLEIELAKKSAAEKKDAEALAILNRRRKEALDQLNQRNENQKLHAERCPHTDQRGGSTIWPVSNQPDGQLLGICSQCPIQIRAAHYEEDAYGKKTLIPEHPLYKQVLERDRAIYGGFVQLTSY